MAIRTQGSVLGSREIGSGLARDTWEPPRTPRTYEPNYEGMHSPKRSRGAPHPSNFSGLGNATAAPHSVLCTTLCAGRRKPRAEIACRILPCASDGVACGVPDAGSAEASSMRIISGLLSGCPSILGGGERRSRWKLWSRRTQWTTAAVRFSGTSTGLHRIPHLRT